MSAAVTTSTQQDVSTAETLALSVRQLEVEYVSDRLAVRWRTALDVRATLGQQPHTASEKGATRPSSGKGEPRDERSRPEQTGAWSSYVPLARS